MTVHVPALVTETLDYLNLAPGKLIVDATVGTAGHLLAISNCCPGCELIGIDRDPAALIIATKRLEGRKVRLVEGNYADISQLINGRLVDGILIDCGLSTFQLDDEARGFSFRLSGPLDMRFGSAGQTAADLINTVSEHELADIIYRYGEERKSRQIAKAMVANRPVKTTQALAAIIRCVVLRQGKIDPATKTFQALRIATNFELESLEKFLPQAIKALAPGGRLVTISYHSLEDRIVKRFFQQQAKEGRITILTKHVVRPSNSEVLANRRSRSAKLRAALKL